MGRGNKRNGKTENQSTKAMKKWVTSIMALDPITNEMKKWCGPEVFGETLKDAEDYCQNNGLGYCKVEGLLICEIPYGIAEYATLLYSSDRDN